MNIKQLKSIVLVLSILLAFACATKKEEAKTDAADDREWKEMDDYHMIMADAFHPFKDSANLEPAKMKAAELATSAEKWASAPIPAKVNNDEMKTKLQQLKAESAAFAQIVAAGDSKAIGDALTNLHDLFHAIQESWYAGGKEGEHEHEHH